MSDRTNELVVEWLIEMGGYAIALEKVDIPQIREMTDEVVASVEPKLLAGMPDGTHVQLVFVVDEDRNVSFVIRGPNADVQAARDILGEQFTVGQRRN